MKDFTEFILPILGFIVLCVLLVCLFLYIGLHRNLSYKTTDDHKIETNVYDFTTKSPSDLPVAGTGGAGGFGRASSSVGGSGSNFYTETIRKYNKDGTYYYVYKDHLYTEIK